METESKKKRVLAISSRGGHWVELIRLKEAFADQDVTYVTTVPEYQDMVNGANFRVVTEATRDNKLRLIRMFIQIFWIMLWIRPDAVVTTGAAPGVAAVWLGRRFGARTLFVDSVAACEEISLSGKLALPHSDAFLTQWQHLASGRVEFHGANV